MPPGDGNSYETLMSVSREKGFDFDKLTDMFIAESSGRPDTVNPSGYTGGFQFGEKTGKEYGLVGDGFDYRKDLKKSAVAAIDMYRDSTEDFSENVMSRIKERNMGIGQVGYLTHQQGRFGFQDIITGSKSGKIKASTRKNMLENIGNNDWSSMDDKELSTKFLDFWDTRWKEKRVEAENWRIKNMPAEDGIIESMIKEDNGVF